MSSSGPHRWHGPPPSGPPVLVGVVPGQDPSVVAEAARVARAMRTGLVCVWVDGSRMSLGQDADGSLRTTPVDPDEDDDGVVEQERAVAAAVEVALAGHDIPWIFVYAAGEPARNLDEVARRYDAALIAVGARRPGLGSWMERVVGGSVAGHLAHTQRRPVLVVPVPPGDPG